MSGLASKVANAFAVLLAPPVVRLLDNLHLFTRLQQRLAVRDTHLNLP